MRPQRTWLPTGPAAPAGPAPGSAATPAPGSATFRALGTYATVLVTRPALVKRAAGLLAAELRAVDAACSRFRAGSGLWQVNQAGGRPVRVSPLLAEALSVALAAAEATGGDVDPTCGLSLARLGYDRDFADARARTGAAAPPAPAAGWRTVQFDPARRVVQLPRGAMLDLGATAKAMAADRAATAIAATLDCGVLVNLGGDIRVSGPPPAGGWLVGVSDDLGFDDRPGGPGPVVAIRDGGLATSSTAVRAWYRGGTRMHHIIDPATGLPADSCWRTVSVAAASCVAANTASTAAILRGERATGWLAGLRLPARLAGQGGELVTVSGWPADALTSPPSASRSIPAETPAP